MNALPTEITDVPIEKLRAFQRRSLAAMNPTGSEIAFQRLEALHSLCGETLSARRAALGESLLPEQVVK